MANLSPGAACLITFERPRVLAGATGLGHSDGPR